MSVWEILGNSPNANDSFSGSERRLIAFNEGFASSDITTRIINRRLSRIPGKIECRGELPFTDFVEALNAEADRLAAELKCWPSLGLTTVVVMRQRVHSLNVRFMNLLPSLQCSGAIADAAYHNWLAERRAAFSAMLHEKCHWPDIWVPEPRFGQRGWPEPVETLLQLQSQPGNLAALSELAETAATHWQKSLERRPHNILDGAFFVPREPDTDAGWWLFDKEARLLVERIRYQLAWLQQPGR